MWNFASKSACGLIAALMLLSLAPGQRPGGGSGGGPSDPPVVISNGQFQITTTKVCYSANSSLTPQGASTSTTASNVARATARVLDVVGSISAKAGGTYTHLIKWIGSGSPPPYAYAVITSSGNYGIEEGGTGQIELGLPITGDSVPSRQRGRKVVKLKLDTNGEAVFTVTGSVTATANSPYIPGLLNSYTTGAFGSGADLAVKALGLSYDSTTRAVDVTPTGPNVYAWPAGGDDFERQKAEFSVSIKHGWINLNPLPIGPPIPSYVITGAMYNVWSDVNYLGVWGAANITSSVSPGVRSEHTDTGGNVSSIEFSNDFSVAELEAMRLAPKEVTLTIQGMDPVHTTPPGPFNGELKAYVWAPERVIATGEDTVTTETVREINGCDTVTVAAGGDETLEVSSVTTNEWTAEVSVTGGLSGDIDEIGVKADCGFKLGYKHSVALGGKHSKHVTPAVRTKYWYVVTTTVTNMNRALAGYGDRGYTGDYSNRILYSKKPTRNGEFHWEELP